MIRAKAARPLRPTLPMVVLTRGLPDRRSRRTWALPPGFPDEDTIERIWQKAQDWLAALVPYARHVIARKSNHYVLTEQPELVIDAVRRELRMVRPATVRCRGGGDSCRARVSLAGGASDKRVTIELSDTDLRLVSVRPNRRSLRGAYGLFDQRLRSGGSEYAVQAQRRAVDPAGLGSGLHLPGRRRPLRRRPVGVWPGRAERRTAQTAGAPANRAHAGSAPSIDPPSSTCLSDFSRR